MIRKRNAGGIWLFALALTMLSCQKNQAGRVILTYTLERSDFPITVEAQGEIEAAKSHVLTVPQVQTQPEIAYLKQEGSFVSKDEIVVELQADQIEQEYRRARDDVEIARAEALKKEAELNLQRLLIETQIKSAEATLQTASLQLSKLEFEAPATQKIKRLEIEEQELQTEKNKKKLASLANIRKEEMSNLQLRIKIAQNKLSRAQGDLEKLSLKAPVDGILIYQRSWMTGEKVQEGDALYPSMPVVSIPDLSVMQLNLKIGETAAQKLAVGQNAEISVPLFDDLVISGKVTRVDKMAKPIKRGSKIKKVEVIVTLDSTFAGIVPGLTAGCTILIERIPEALALPQECIFEKDKVKFVYARDKDKFVATPVSVVQQHEDFVIIKGDLHNPIDCALMEPAADRIVWPDTLVTPEITARSEAERQTADAQIK